MNMEAAEKFGALAAARKSAVLTQEEMAEKLGCSRPSIVKWEKDPTTIRIKDLQSIYENVGADGKAIIADYVNGLFF